MSGSVLSYSPNDGQMNRMFGLSDCSFVRLVKADLLRLSQSLIVDEAGIMLSICNTPLMPQPISFKINFDFNI